MKSKVELVGMLISIGAIVCGIVLSHADAAEVAKQSLAAVLM